MTGFEVYSFIVCLIVFLLFGGVFAFFISYYVKTETRMVEAGLNDAVLKIEYEKLKRKSRFSIVFDRAVSFFLCAFACLILVASIATNIISELRPGGSLSVKVVQSQSMALAHPQNTYLEKNGLTDRLEIHDAIVLHPMPKQEELKLYDIVMYEIDGEYVIHRIIAIEEPNAKHPDTRRFVLQGDAVPYPDAKMVEYSEMRGIYYGQKIPYVGSFVMFIKSPAGWLCIALIIFVIFLAPRLERKMWETKMKQLYRIGYVTYRDIEALNRKLGMKEF